MNELRDYLNSLEFGAPVTLDDVTQARAEIKALVPSALVEIWHTISEVRAIVLVGEMRVERRYTVRAV